MNFIIAQLVLLGIFMAVPCQAQNMRVKEVKNKEAVLEYTDTGKKVNVKEGEILQDGWKVYEIKSDMVTLEKQTGPSELVRAQMPVGIHGVGYTQPVSKGSSTQKAANTPKGSNAGTTQGGRVK